MITITMAHRIADGRALVHSDGWIHNLEWTARLAWGQDPVGLLDDWLAVHRAVVRFVTGDMTTLSGPIIEEPAQCRPCMGTGVHTCPTCGHGAPCPECHGTGTIGPDSRRGRRHYTREDGQEVAVSDLYGRALLDGLVLRQRADDPLAAICANDGERIEAMVMPMREPKPEEVKRDG